MSPGRSAQPQRPLLPLLLVLAGCEFHDAGDDWHDQLVPDSPCYRVDLLDGLSEANTDELHDLYDCLDQGNFTALGGLVTHPAKD